MSLEEIIKSNFVGNLMNNLEKNGYETMVLENEHVFIKKSRGNR